MIDKLPLVPVVSAAIATVPYMYFQREWSLEADAIAVFVALALLFSAVQWRVRKWRGS
jgi:hypothetical protein